MKKTFLLILFLLPGIHVYAQQWSGSSGTSGTIQRIGNVEIGDGLLEGNDAYLHVNEGRARFGYSGLRKATSIWAGSGKHIVFDTGGDNERMRIDKDGKVGIGVWNPSARLEVAGSLYIQRGGELNFTVYEGSKRAGIKATNSNPYNELQFFTGSYQEAMRIKDNGNVGIGTTNPGSYKLAVKGKIIAEEIQVVVSVPADYVFDEDYKLKELSEVEQYVNTHKHLPEIPSAKEIKEQGWEVGKMQNLLLQKIEELTLYVIEQDKRLEKQNEILEKQSEEIAYLKNENQKLHSANEKIQHTISNLK